MVKRKISELKDFILTNNPYLVKGYDMVYMDSTRGFVADEKLVVFPNDTLGNYFYMRLDDELKFEKGDFYNLSDAQANMGIRATIYLVAVMKGADSDLLLNNIISTIQQSTCSVKANINFTGAIYESEAIIERELKKTSKETIATALKNNKSTIVSVKFDISETFNPIKLNCIENPCTC